MKRSLQALGLATVVVGVFSPVAAEACGVCMGQTDGGQIPTAINGAIFLMLGFIGAMLTGITAVGYWIFRKGSAPIPPHVQLAEMIGTQPTK